MQVVKGLEAIDMYFPTTFMYCKENYYVFIEDGIILGSANLISSLNYVYVLNLESSERGKGYGRRMVEYLLEQYGTIEGQSTKEALGFWSKYAKIEKDDFIIGGNIKC